MKLANVLLPAALSAFALVACQQSGSDENIVIDETNNMASADMGLPPSGESAMPTEDINTVNEAEDAGSEDASPPELPEAAMIPRQYSGRWGMNAADCERGRSDAKGLITIGDKTVRFYESVATLKEQRPAIATSFSGLFAFTGEGQTWEKVMTFTRTGDTLKRAEKDGTFTYRRCS